MENDWTTDIECVLENIRQNASKIKIYISKNIYLKTCVI
jgi:hypothetical protein